MSKFSRSLICVAAAAICLGGPVLVQAQTFPSKPITWIVPFPPGGVTDPVSRMVGAKVAESIGQPVLIDNRPGAAGIIGAELVKKAPRSVSTIGQAKNSAK